MSTYIDPNTETWIEQLQARIAELETTLEQIRQHYEDVHAEEVNELNARIAELEKKSMQCPRCGDPVTNELGDNPICGACALASELNGMALLARITELEKLLSGNPQTMTTQEMLAMPLNSEIALCNGCYIMRVPGGWIYKDTYNYSDGCGVSAMGVFVPEPSDIACDAHIEKSATQAPLPVSGATQAEVDND